MVSDKQKHWETVYTSKNETEVSWYEDCPELSLALLRKAGLQSNHAVIDVGGGASRLVDYLVSQGQAHVTVLDLSAAALDIAKARLGNHADHAHWVEADVTAWSPDRTYDFWHDRAAFHFLVEPADQQAYVQTLSAALEADGIAVFATFAPDGPKMCSGLPVVRHDAGSLSATLGSAFEFVTAQEQDHKTPWGSVQKFQFSVFRKVDTPKMFTEPPQALEEARGADTLSHPPDARRQDRPPATALHHLWQPCADDG